MTDARTEPNPPADVNASGIVSSVWLAGFEPMALDERERHALELLRKWEPDEGYYVAFSGGKDSIVIKRLCEMAGVRFDAHYNQTTIDPPELVRFIKQHHPDVGWNLAEKGNMMHRVATAPKVPPTRLVRWCCGEYKERSGEGRVRVFGVRKAESASRAKRWNEVADYNGQLVICPDRALVRRRGLGIHPQAQRAPLLALRRGMDAARLRRLPAGNASDAGQRVRALAGIRAQLEESHRRELGEVARRAEGGWHATLSREIQDRRRLLAMVAHATRARLLPRGLPRRSSLDQPTRGHGVFGQRLR